MVPLTFWRVPLDQWGSMWSKVTLFCENEKARVMRGFLFGTIAVLLDRPHEFTWFSYIFAKCVDDTFDASISFTISRTYFIEVFFKWRKKTITWFIRKNSRQMNFWCEWECSFIYRLSTANENFLRSFFVLRYFSCNSECFFKRYCDGIKIPGRMTREYDDVSSGE